MKRRYVVLIALLISAALCSAQDLPTAPSADPAATAPASGTAVSAPAQTVPATGTAPAASAQPAADSAASLESAHYIVSSELGQARAAGLSEEFEALFKLFSETFRFDPSTLQAKLKVREFATKDAFDAYLQKAAGQKKDDFVYVYYSVPERCELLIYPKEGPEAAASLVHQAFVQYLKSFVDNPPLWMRDGFAVYFESAVWDSSSRVLSFPENLAWLPSVKSLLAKKALLPVSRMLELTPDESRSSINVVYPESWAFASFLMNTTDKAYSRLLWDSISALRRDASLTENQAAIAARTSSWYVPAEADAAFTSYLGSRKTFSDFIAEGAKSYTDKAYDAARSSFEAAAKINTASYIPPYYLGLVAYSTGDHSLADFYYRAALEKGCDPAVAAYALGLNAFAAEKYDEAKKYLLDAKSRSPERYGPKVDGLLARMSK